MTRAMTWFLGLGILSACGGGTSGPNPPPPPPPPPGVATVEVTPATASLFVGDTVRLTATAKTAAGVVVSGKTVAWSSGAPAVATVASDGLATALTAGSAVLTASVDGKAGTAQLTVAERVVLDVAHRVSKPIGSAGDSLKTTSAGGASYTLVVPEGALPANVTVTMTPVGSIQGLSLSGGLLAGVKLEPAGTEFLRPIELRITNGLAVPAGKLLIGFTVPDAGGTPALLPASTAGGITRVVAGHFSIVGLGAVLPSELQALTPPNNTGGRLTRLAGLAAILAQGGSSLTLLQQLVPFFAAWFEDIRPILQASDRTDADLLTAIPEYAYWAMQADYAGTAIGQTTLIQIPELLSKASDGVLALAAGFDAAIRRANADCEAQRSLTKATLVLFWQEQAEQVIGARDLAVPAADILPALGLDRAAVLASFCIQVVNTELLFPDPVIPNQSATLQLRFGIKFGADPNLMLPPHVFDLEVDLSGTTTDGRQNRPTAADGRLALSVVPTGQVSFRARVKACADVLLLGASDICADVELIRPFGRTIIGDVIVLTPQGLQGIADVAKIQGNLSIQGGSGNPVTDLELLVGLQEVTGLVSLSNLPELTSLSGLRNLRTVQQLELSSLPKLQSVDGLDQLVTIPSTLTLSFLPLVPNLQGFAQLRTIGALQLNNLPLVVSLAGINQATIAGVSIIAMPALTSLAGPVFVSPTLPGSVNLQDNPLLTNLGGLRGLTRIDGSLILVNNPVIPVLDFATVTDVGRDVRIAESSLTSIGFLGIQRIGRDLLVHQNELPQMATFELPSLTRVGSRLLLDPTTGGACTRTGAPLLVRFPALTRIEHGLMGVQAGGSSAPCLADFELPALNFLGDALAPGEAGFRDVTLGPMSFTGDFVLGSTTVRSLRFVGPFDITGSMRILRNRLLTTLSGTGRVSGDLSVTENTSLSQSAATAWATAVTVGGTRFVASNKIP